MSFNVLFLAHSPDADPAVHRSQIDTGKFKLFSIVVKNQAQALEIVKTMTIEHSLDSILLCPGFTHVDVAEIFSALVNRAFIPSDPGGNVIMNARIPCCLQYCCFGNGSVPHGEIIPDRT